MSYILNALRKSEKERQALQPETATDRILIQETDPSAGSFNWKMLLIVSNLLALITIMVAAAVWYSQQPTVAPANGPLQDAPKLGVEKQGAKPPKPAEIEKKAARQPPSQPAASKTETATPTIAELAEANRGDDQNAPEKQPLQSRESRIQPAKIRDQPAPNLIGGTKAAPVDASAKVLPGDGNHGGIVATADGNIPFLSDLPEPFRRSVPKMTINVFVYTPDAPGRFVMIDMAKYKAGQQTPSGVDIKEIRNDSLVVGYNGRIFRIERP